MPSHDISGKPRIILDTCILIDIAVTSRPRHSIACKLNKELKSRGVIIVMPMHAHFELISATKHEVRKSTETEMFKSDVREADHLEYFAVSINEEFVKKYSCTDLPNMSACDAIFVAMAKVDGLDLVTEDEKHYQHAKGYGVRVFKIKEYLEQLTG